MVSNIIPFPRKRANDDAPNPDPQQPDLRAFIVYNEKPDDSSAPFLRAGDFVVIDPKDRDPAPGELFVITWKSSFDREWKIVQMDLRKGRYGKGEIYEEGSRWFVGAPAPERMMSLAGLPDDKAIRWADGPYQGDYCREITHGKIVGIYQPDFRNMLREAV